jgi:2,4-dienoyl-CoA reductase-like NADH-dependent reductase (Old Yellow Enzyme family)/thioredoxin reductase
MADAIAADGVGQATLFRPGYIGSLLLRNRIVMAPMGTLAENPEGTVSQRAIDYYAERARGGVGMIVTGGQLVSNKLESWTYGWSALDTDQQTKAWKLLTDRVKAYGARACVQLSPGLGRAGFAWPGMERVFPSASAIPSIYYPDVPTRPMTVDEIDYIVGCMARAAGRAQTAGFDAIQIHGHVGYLIDQFMTPAWNKRDDAYGGSLENRMRLVTDMIDAIRNEVGADMPVLFRFCMDHCFEGGRTLEEGQEIIRFLDDYGGIDAYDINIGSYDYHPSLSLNAYFGDQPAMYAVRAARAATTKPLINAGNHTPETAAAAVADGLVDFISLGRSLLADPDWANKVRGGRQEEVRPCIRCNEYCMNGVWKGMTASCAVNARCSAESDYPMTPAAASRRVAVIGAGPAGMEAARVAATRGHSVDLYERATAIGGNLRASRGPYKTQLAKLLAYYQRQLGALGVRIHLDSEVDAGTLARRVDADHIIVATGAIEAEPAVPGLHRPWAMSVRDYYLSPEAPAGKRVVIVGGQRVACDAAIDLAAEGHDVTLIFPEPSVCGASSPDDQAMIVRRLHDHGVALVSDSTVLRVEGEDLVVAGGAGEETRQFTADTILYDFGRVPDASGVEAFVFADPALTVIGDCEAVGVIGQAIRRGFFTAWAIG